MSEHDALITVIVAGTLGIMASAISLVTLLAARRQHKEYAAEREYLLDRQEHHEKTMTRVRRVVVGEELTGLEDTIWRQGYLSCANAVLKEIDHERV